ncbi:NAD(P)/FAD-dependent oxidoreductase [Edaphobacter sp.]|uniref:NAD(P)/FAD-dependent oxidoreductase n=1 Tax=Edaphobacter sp. TaxID=1934404 RepID=UPI002DB89517|nr:FAD-dependent oxidoreductase [Edaphobacter sp.]HEU5341025.1 FAD-dependent oxidoreductase [Edaphobacter sp.]
MNRHYDLAIVGSGFSGSLLAMIARRLGHSVILIERGAHPRVVIGESSTPLANLLLEELATRYDLPAIRPLCKWGTWQAAHSEVACGLKRGFTFYHHNLDHPTPFPPDRKHQLLVAASPHDHIADTHWYRADFDHFLVREAQNLGVEYFDETRITAITDSADAIHLQATRHGKPLQINANFLIDASGPRGFLHRALNLSEKLLPDFPQTQALYSHFSGVDKLESQLPQQDTPPYPVDSAAVHHVFDGGWIWVLQFNNGITSAGIAATDISAAQYNLSEGAAAWHCILEHIPALQRQFTNAKPTQPFSHIPRISFLSDAISGKRWALLPSAAGFVDPLLSTGFPLTLLGIGRIAEIIEQSWKSPELESQLAAYAAKTEADLLAAARIIAALYTNLDNFPTFISLSLLYFAAVSFTETARRLGKSGLAPSFLLHDNSTFGPACARLCQRALHLHTKDQAHELSEDILRMIEPFNVAGLGNHSRRNWYPVDPRDLIEAAPKLQATPEDMRKLLERCGF